MKRKSLFLILILCLLCIAGCKKEEEILTPTPIPVSENPTISELETHLSRWDLLLSNFPEAVLKFDNGAGFDVMVELTLEEAMAEKLNLAEPVTISGTGSLDIKTQYAADLNLYLEGSELWNTKLFVDADQVLLHLPKYTFNYAKIPTDFFASSTRENIRLFRTYLADVIGCFQPTETRVSNATIGTGSYQVTGDKYTVRAGCSDVFTILNSLERELTMANKERLPWKTLKTDGASSLILDYYTGKDTDYAFVVYPDNQPKNTLVFVSTSLGFCLYSTDEADTVTTLMYSEESADKTGVIYIPTDTEEAEDTIEYAYSDSELSTNVMLGSKVYSIDFTKGDGTYLYSATTVIDGASTVLDITITPDHLDISGSRSTYGQDSITFSVSAFSRDFEAFSFPQSSVSLISWKNGISKDTLQADRTAVLKKHPFLAEFFGISGNNEPGSPATEQPPVDVTPTPSVPEESGQTFEKLTGYSVDADGYVEFYPVESEVLALGKPSTGLESIKITENQKQALLDYAKVFFDTNSTYSLYWVWGNLNQNDIQSFYTKDYEFSDSKNANNKLTFEFDAVSGDFVSVSIYYEEEGEAINMINDLLAILEVEYTVTSEIVEEYTMAHNFAFTGYDGAAFGEDYYYASFSVYYPEW